MYENDTDDLFSIIQARNLRIQRLLDIQRRIGSERNVRALPALVMSEIATLMDVDRTSLFLLDPYSMQLRATFAEGMNSSIVVPLRMGIVGTAILRGCMTNIVNAYEHPYFNAEIDAVSGYKTDSLLVAPIFSPDGKVWGCVELINKATGRFTLNDQTIIEEGAARAASQILNSRFDHAAARLLIEDLKQDTDCDRGSVFLLNEPLGQLESLYTDGANDLHIRLNLKLGIAGLGAVSNQTLLIPDAHADPRFDASFDLRTGYRTRNLLTVPLGNADGEVIGVVQAINKRFGDFTTEDVETLQSIAAIVGIAIENAQLLEDHDRQFHSILEALAASIDAKDTLTAGHSQKVADIACAIGGLLSYTESELDVLRVAAILHDYGKIGIEDRVLKKAGKLDEDEYAHMKQHASLTYDILARIHFARKYTNVPMIASSHHENIDGSGYPRGFGTKEIPFMAKILAVADVFEALTADRHYRPGMSVDAAMGIIESEVGRKFDPNVVSALKTLIAKGDLS
jgi:GAF domain-containing protein